MSHEIESGSQGASSGGAEGPLQSVGKRIDESRPVRAAVETAHAVGDRVSQIQQSVSEGYERLRAQNIGDVFDETMGSVRRNPGRGLLTAFAVGVALAWVFRD